MILTGIPYLATVRSVNNLRDVRRWHIPTDEGVVRVEEYAKAFGLKINAATSRIHRVANGEYTLEQAMMPAGSRQITKPCRRVTRDPEEENRIPPEDYGKFAHLSSRVRDRNLSKVRNIGTWEEQYYAGM